MFPYAVETFTAAEEDVLRRYVTNLDQPVFALVNLPEVVKGALFARYSRSPKSLRRLFLDEFVGELDITGDATVDATVGLRRAEQLYEKVFFEYGDDSVAQLGGVHLACEQASNVLTKVLERGRLMAYLEQSTRYIAYNQRLTTGHYRYYRDPDLLDSPFGARYVGEMDRMFDTYGELVDEAKAFLSVRHPRQPGDSDFVHRQAIRAKALDALRGLLPAASLSNVGIYGTGQSYEALLLRMRSHPLPEARRYATMMLDELRKVIPSFLQRVDRPDRGGEWSAYLEGTRQATAERVEALLADPDPEEDPAHGPSGQPSVALVDFDPDGEDKVIAAICTPLTSLSEEQVRKKSRRAGGGGQAVVATGVRGGAQEPTAPTGPGLRAHRLLLRRGHRLRSLPRSAASPHVDHRVAALGHQARLRRSRRGGRGRVGRPLRGIAWSGRGELAEALAPTFPAESVYAVALAYRIRYSMQMNAREAMHLLELRSGTQGHPSYRWVAQEMHRQIGEVAGHRLLAEAMSHVDHSVEDLGRLGAERRAQERRDSLSGAGNPANV